MRASEPMRRPESQTGAPREMRSKSENFILLLLCGDSGKRLFRH